jgi:hypothetical protein
LSAGRSVITVNIGRRGGGPQCGPRGAGGPARAGKSVITANIGRRGGGPRGAGGPARAGKSVITVSTVRGILDLGKRVENMLFVCLCVCVFVCLYVYVFSCIFVFLLAPSVPVSPVF